jgi:hypothetical protein
MFAELRGITRLNLGELCKGSEFAFTLIRLEAERIAYCLNLYLSAPKPVPSAA